jgi:hypothetical protein
MRTTNAEAQSRKPAYGRPSAGLSAGASAFAETTADRLAEAGPLWRRRGRQGRMKRVRRREAVTNHLSIYKGQATLRGRPTARDIIVTSFASLRHRAFALRL